MQEKDENNPGVLPQGEYIPKHEKTADDTGKEVDVPVAVSEDIRPVYDDFMYEPIGFEDMMSDDSAVTGDKKKKHSRPEKAALILFGLMLTVCISLSVYGIVKDIVKSKDSIIRVEEKKQVVLYRNSKPEGANDLSNFVDENGRYTVEGASADRKSVV